MVDARFFAAANDIDQKVQEGEISGVTTWPLEGTCTLKEIKADYKDGKPYFFLKLVHPVKGTREMAVKVPMESDKDAAKFMGMQKIYATIYPLGKASPGKDSVQVAYQKALDAVGATLNYKMEEYESFSEKHGKMFTNQSLSALSICEEAGEFS